MCSTAAQAKKKEMNAGELVSRVVQDVSGAMGVQVIYIGDKLGLFKMLAEAKDGMTSKALAEKAKCHIRYVETWCQAAVAHSFLETETSFDVGSPDGSRRYWMTAAQKEVLATEGGRSFQCGAAQLATASAGSTPMLIEKGFRNLAGGGISWAELGDDAREGVARMNGVALRDMLPGWVKALPEAKRLLEKSGAKILDVGCGVGKSTFALASAFPNATIIGLDPDESSIAAAQEELMRHQLPNVQFQQKFLEDLNPAEVSFDLILAYDCIHDMPDPQHCLGLTSRLLRRSPSEGDGVVLWFEPHGSDNPYENRDLMGARMVATIAFQCVTTSMAMGGQGLGAHGCTPAKAEALARRSGFQKFRRETELKATKFRNNVYVLQ